MAESARIWLTRPQADSEALATQLREAGIDTLIAPVLRIVPLNPPLPPEMPDALLLTSRNAAHMLAGMPTAWRSLPAFCVGPATEAAAVQAGFSRVIAGASDVLALLPMLAAALNKGARMLYLAGETTRTDVAALLATQGIVTQTLFAYRAVAETTLPDTLPAAFHDGILTGVVFFSPRSAKVACELLTGHGLAAQAAQCEAYCLSLAVAEAAAALPWSALHACHLPTQDAMRDLIVSRRARTVL